MPNIDVSLKSWLTEILKQILALTGILAALAYWLGYAYARGFYKALNIDIGMLQLQWSDYLTFGWLYLFGGGLILVVIISLGVTMLTYYYFFAPLFDEFFEKHKIATGRLSILVCIAVLIFILRNQLLAFWRSLANPWLTLIIVFALLVFLSYRFRDSIRKMMILWFEKLRSPQYGDRLDILFIYGRNLTALIVVLYLFLALMLLLRTQAENSGVAAGYLHLTTEATQAELISPLPLVSSSAKNLDIYTTKNLIFLFYNAGHYYLSTELDSSNNCKPRDVIVINEKDLIGFRKIPTSQKICIP